MYNNTATPIAATPIGLAATGMDVLTIGWLMVAGFTMIFVGLAIKNLLPARKRRAES